MYINDGADFHRLKSYMRISSSFTNINVMKIVHYMETHAHGVLLGIEYCLNGKCFTGYYGLEVIAAAGVFISMQFNTLYNIHQYKTAID